MDNLCAQKRNNKWMIVHVFVSWRKGTTHFYRCVLLLLTFVLFIPIWICFWMKITKRSSSRDDRKQYAHCTIHTVGGILRQSFSVPFQLSAQCACNTQHNDKCASFSYCRRAWRSPLSTLSENNFSLHFIWFDKFSYNENRKRRGKKSDANANQSNGCKGQSAILHFDFSVSLSLLWV